MGPREPRQRRREWNPCPAGPNGSRRPPAARARPGETPRPAQGARLLRRPHDVRRDRRGGRGPGRPGPPAAAVAIGFDTEFNYDRPGVVIDQDHTAHDPRSVRPLVLSLALAEPDGGDGGTLSTFVVDLRRPEVLPPLGRSSGCRSASSATSAHAELFCLLAARPARSRASCGTRGSARRPCTSAGTTSSIKLGPAPMTSTRPRRGGGRAGGPVRYSLVATCRATGSRTRSRATRTGSSGRSSATPTTSPSRPSRSITPPPTRWPRPASTCPRS